jgi:hypothetical protein
VGEGRWFIVSIFLVNGPIKVAHCKIKINKNIWDAT